MSSDKMKSKETFVVDNEYTLSVITTRRPPEDESFKALTTITRSFNFLARQVTTHVRDTVLGNEGGYHYGGAAGVSTGVIQQHFDDFRSDAEIVYMHAKLKEMGGKPPALEDVTRGLQKKPRTLTPEG